MIHPEIKEIEKVDLLNHEKIILKNGLPLYLVQAGKQALVKVDVVFDAGNVRSKDPVLPGAVNALLNDGSRRFSSSDIADMIDGKGAFYVPDIQKDFSQTSMYLLSKFSGDLMALYVEMLNESTFPEEEVEMFKRNMKQRFLVEHEKVNVQSYQAFNNALFGEDSSYADLTKAENYDTLNRNEIIDFYTQKVQYKPKCIIVSGMADDASLAEICNRFEQYELEKVADNEKIIAYGDVASTKEWIKIPGNNNQQVSMRLGRPTVSNDHPDYWGLSLLSTILGGYFGSRLNKVIREEKGLTYGIHSSINKLKEASFLSIHAELNAANWEEAYSSVLDVFNDLKENPIPAQELNMVRKYIKGSLLQSIDGAFSYSTYLRNAIVYDMDINRVNEYIHFLDNVDSIELMNLAEQYLQENSFYKIVAGV